MANYLLRIESVNFDETIFDTQDLSTLRGSSLAILNATREVEELLLQHYDAAQVMRVSSGASIGLWKIDLPNDDGGASLCAQARAWLAGKQLPSGFEPSALKISQHFNFVVDALPLLRDEEFIEVRERAIAANRWRQMSQPLAATATTYKSRVPEGKEDCVSVRRPDGTTEPKPDSAVCEIDLKRPRMDEPAQIKGAAHWVSRVTRDRRDYGVQAKQVFYCKTLRTDYDVLGNAFQNPEERLPFALHFASVSEGQNKQLKQSLRDKIAVLYVDGNRFSKIIDELLEGEGAAVDQLGASRLERQLMIDQKMQRYRREFLLALLQLIEKEGAIGAANLGESEERRALKHRSNNPVPKIETDEVVRLETLLWGGDEFRVVLPARLGFSALQLFFDLAEGRQGERWQLGGMPLEHAAGLIFCHHDAPIDRISRLSGELAELAKGVDRTRSLMLCLVLETFDHTGGDLEEYWRRQLPYGIAFSDMVVQPRDIAALEAVVSTLKSEDFGRRQVRMLVMALQKKMEFDDLRRRLGGLYPNLDEWLRPIADLFEEPVFWLLAELCWDYLAIGAETHRVRMQTA